MQNLLGVGDGPFNHDSSRHDLDDYHFQVHGDHGFIFDNEDVQHFHGTQP